MFALFSDSRTPLPLTPVRSSNIAAIGHEAETQILQVAFLDGSVYQYFDVPEEVYEAFITALSKIFVEGN